MILRRATPDDVTAISIAHHAAIRQICSSAYSPEQIDAWTSALTIDRYEAAMDRFDFVVAELEGRVVGFAIADLPGAELNALYVAPSAGGRGVGSALLEAAEARARAAGVARLTLKATLNAVSFYEEAGYVRLCSARHALPGGRELPCVGMAKLLSNAPA